ncbi:MAG TPA: citrate lyase acyl carrier protein [Rectinemataceae bacterium]|nr:citrate lyase acyl carrier protein [Rectinemataceae bacterium]
MEIIKTGIAGTLESCDASVTVERAAELELLVESADRRFAKSVRQAALAALAELGVKTARVTVREKSALDCTVRARVLTACLRAAGLESAPWEALK